MKFSVIRDSACFTRQASSWETVVRKGELLSDLTDFLQALDEKPDLRAAAMLRSLERIRDELVRIPESAELGSSVQLTLQDVLIMVG